jgi:hypothetical protein
VPTAISKVRVVQTVEPEAEALTSGLDRLAAAAAVGSAEDILDAIRGLVPECVPPLRQRSLQGADGD